MGNFYANHVLPTTNADAVAAALEKRAKAAYVALGGNTTFVYDEQCDEQDLDELRRVAALLSRECGVAVLAACNHDDDVLWLALGDRGQAIDIYESAPGYFDGGQSPPRISNVDRVCAAFSVPGAVGDIERLLGEPHASFTFEVERHRALLRLLRVESDAGLLGYGYVSRGELAGVDPDARLRSIAGASDLDASPRAVRRTGGLPAAELPRDDRAMVISPDHAARVQRTGAALALSEIELPSGFAAIFGEGRLNGFIAFTRFQQYLRRTAVLDAKAADGPIFRFDALTTRLLGVEQCSLQEVAPLFAERLGVWEALAADVRAAIEAGDPKIQLRMAEVLLPHLPELSE